MATLVSFHAHPDDECIATGGVMAKAAAERLAAILREERADVLLTYDDHGGYGHPDHIQVHRVGVRAAELAGTSDVYESTFNRDETRKMMAAAREAGAEVPGDVDPRAI